MADEFIKVVAPFDYRIGALRRVGYPAAIPPHHVLADDHSAIVVFKTLSSVYQPTWSMPAGSEAHSDDEGIPATRFSGFKFQGRRQSPITTSSTKRPSIGSLPGQQILLA